MSYGCTLTTFVYQTRLQGLTLFNTCRLAPFSTNTTAIPALSSWQAKCLMKQETAELFHTSEHPSVTDPVDILPLPSEN